MRAPLVSDPRLNPPTYSFDAGEAFQTLLDDVVAFGDAQVAEASERAPELFGIDADRVSIDSDCRFVPLVHEVRATVRKRAVERGFYGMSMPGADGSAGMTCLGMSMLDEALSTRPAYPSVLWPDLTIHMLGRAWGPTPVLLRGSDEIKDRYLAPLMSGEATTCIALTDPDAGSDPQNMRATATHRGSEWVINGRKRFVGNSPYADFLMVYARTSGEPGDHRGISLFIVEKGTPGFEVVRVNRVMEGLGNHGELSFEDCHVPEANLVGEEGRGFGLAMEYVSAARLSIASRSLGGAQWLLDHAIERARSRVTFGQPLADRQAIQWMIADLATDIEQLRWLIRHAASRVDAGDPARVETSMAKVRGPAVYHHAADVAMQIFGGLGYLSDEPIERAYRRARGYRFIEGTDEMQRQSIARQLLKG